MLERLRTGRPGSGRRAPGRTPAGPRRRGGRRRGPVRASGRARSAGRGSARGRAGPPRLVLRERALLADQADVGAEGQLLQLRRGGRRRARPAGRRLAWSRSRLISSANRDACADQAWSQACSARRTRGISGDGRSWPGPGARRGRAARPRSATASPVTFHAGLSPRSLTSPATKAAKAAGSASASRPGAAVRRIRGVRLGEAGQEPGGRPAAGRAIPSSSTVASARAAGLVLVVVEEDDEPVLARGPEGQRRRQAIADAEGLRRRRRRRRARRPRRRRRRPGRARRGTSPPGRRAGSACAERVEGVGPGGPGQRPRGLLAERRRAGCPAAGSGAAARRGRPARRGRRGPIPPASSQSAWRSFSGGSGAVASASSGVNAAGSPWRASALAARRRTSACALAERLRQRGHGVGRDQRLERREPDRAVLVVERPDEERLRGGGVLLDQRVDGLLAEVGVARAERRVEELQPLRLLARRSAKASPRRAGSGSLKNSRRRSQPQGSADLGHRLGSTSRRTSAWTLRQDEPEGARRRPRRACRFSAALNASDRTAGKLSFRARARRSPGGLVGPLRRGLADLGDRGPAGRGGGRPRRGVQARLGGEQRVGLVEPRQRGEGGVADLGLLVVQQRPEPLDRAGVVERGHRPADLGAGRLVLLAAELEQQPERPRVAQHGQPVRPAQAGVERPARRRLEQRLEVGVVEPAAGSPPRAGASCRS